MSESSLFSERVPQGVSRASMTAMSVRINRMAVIDARQELVLWDSDKPDEPIRLALDGSAVTVTGTFEFSTRGWMKS